MAPQKTTVDEILAVLKTSDLPVLDASQIGDGVDKSAQTVRNRSEEMDEHDEIASMKIGHTTVWWYVGPPDAREPLSGREMEEAYDEFGQDVEDIDPVEPPENGEPLGQNQDRDLPGSIATDGGHTPVEQTLTNLTVYSGFASIAALLGQLPDGLLPWPVALGGVLAFAISYLALRAERNIRSNRFGTAVRTGLGGLWGETA